MDTSGNDTYCGILIDTVEKPGQILEQLPCVNIGKSHDSLLRRRLQGQGNALTSLSS